MIPSLSSMNKQLVFLISCMVCTLRSSSVAGVAWPSLNGLQIVTQRRRRVPSLFRPAGSPVTLQRLCLFELRTRLLRISHSRLSCKTESWPALDPVTEDQGSTASSQHCSRSTRLIVKYLDTQVGGLGKRDRDKLPCVPRQRF